MNRDLMKRKYLSIMGKSLVGVLVNLLLILALAVPSSAVSFDIPHYSVTDDGDPSQFAFNFSQSLPNLTSVVGTLSVTLTMTDAGDGTVSLLFDQDVLLTASGLTASGSQVSSSTPFFDAGTTLSISGTPPFPPFFLVNSSYHLPCPILLICFFDSIEFSSVFTGSGGGDSYDFSGRLTIDNLNPTPVPEPNTFLLLASGVAMLGYFYRQHIREKR